jgi:intracellular sulfur oxidation DsrE/DsrF family protein
MAGSHYVLIESRDPFDSTDTAFVADTAAELRRRGRPVTVFLVQNGVLATRAGARSSHVARLAGAGVTVLADEFSLAERGIGPDELAAGVRRSDIDALVELLVTPGAKAVWH